MKINESASTFRNTPDEELHRQISLCSTNKNPIFTLNLKWYFTSVNEACETLFGYTSSELLNMTILEIIYYEDILLAMKAFEQSLEKKFQNVIMRVTNKYGKIVYLNVTILPNIIEEQMADVYCISKDITEQKTTEESFVDPALQDYLTGLPDRKMLDQHLQNKLLAAQKNLQAAVVFIYLDRFKVLNNSLGSLTGNLLLKEVSKRLKNILNDEDSIFRQGDNEFIVILFDANRKFVTRVVKRIMHVLSDPFKIGLYDIIAPPFIGISLYPEDGDSAESLIKQAEFAMYQAKKIGKNTFQFYSSYGYKENMSPLKIETDLHKALERNEFLLHYQPKINLKTGNIVGVEALLRWNHPELGMLSPNTFIPIAEETGLIILIGEWALIAACKQNKEWHQQGFSPIISVNLSARQFTESDFVGTVARALRETALEPHYLDLEITESMTADIERTILTLRKLKKLGVRISIDDFGTGFSSLNYLKQFPVDTLKIDQSFVRELHNNPNDETIVKTIISMAHNLNLSVVAEGINTKEQLVFLQQHLCDEGQGYLFSKPIPANTLSERLPEIQQMVKELGVSQDVNERMWTEELLRMARKELDDTIRLQQGLIFKFKKINGRFVHTLCDGELLYRLGYIPNEIIGKELQDFLPKEIAKRKEQYYQQVWNNEELVNYEMELNGIHYLSILRPVKRGGEVVEVIGSCMDITDRKMAEKALRESENKYRLIADNTTDLIIILDLDGKILYASPSNKNVLGYSQETLEGRSVCEIIHPEDVSFLSIQYNNMVETKMPSMMEFRIINNTGEWILVESFVSPVVEENGCVKHFVLVGRDITQRRKAEELLWNSEKLSLVGELAAGIAHEIRNPITSIKGFIQLFRQGFMKENYFDIILSEFDRIEDIIKEFLALAKPQEIKPEKVSIYRLIKKVQTLLESEANLQNIEFSVEIESDLPMIICDPNHIKQVFLNICKNSIEAIERNKKGLIQIKVWRESDELVIKITDNGIGISEERLQRLGEPFYSNKEKGTGLGLMVSFRIIKEHKGTMKFNSKENIGTTVEVRLPFSPNK
ncbi:EAL domain-containing protein [Bacillota bacterium Lsc_1132]